MVTYCSIPGCKNTASERKFYFYPFPKNKFYHDKWLDVCSKKLKHTQHARICSTHFRPECFIPRSAVQEYIHQMLNVTRPRALKLIPTAIPTENLEGGLPVVVGEIEENECFSETMNDFSEEDWSSNSTTNKLKVNPIENVPIVMGEIEENEFLNKHLSEAANNKKRKKELNFNAVTTSTENISENKSDIIGEIDDEFENIHFPETSFSKDDLALKAIFVASQEMCEPETPDSDLYASDDEIKNVNYVSQHKTHIKHVNFQYVDVPVDEKPESIYFVPERDTSQKSINSDLDDGPVVEESSECINYVPEYETSQTSNENYDSINEPVDERSSEFLSLIEKMFAPLPECKFSSEDERERYLKNLCLIKKKINMKMMELQDDIEKERREKDRRLKQIEILKREKRNQHNRLVFKCLQFKKSKMYWKKECLAYKIKLHEAKNKS